MIDALVVGAGLSGLVCATRLVDAGASVLVVDARDRVGGRLLTGTIAGRPIDLGGQWMSVGQPRLAALATKLGVASVPQARDGNALFGLPPRGMLSRLATAFAQWRLARRIEHISHAPPRDAHDLSLAAWLAEHTSNPTARALIAMHAELVFAADPASLSLLHYLRTFAATGGFAPRGPDLPGGGREHRFVGGAQTLATKLAERVPVRLATPVRSLVAGDAVEVVTDTGGLAARRVVVAMPPQLARRIEGAFPAAPSAASVSGPVVKCFAAYDRPFWRDDGWSGEAYRPDGTVRATVALEAILLAFVVGPVAAGWSARDPDERRAEVLGALTEQFGDRAATPLDYLEVDWGIDPWSAGCVASLPPGALAVTRREPHGRIHFAGTETAEAWPGYMEGAIEAGERAAREILEAR
ncbi:MAG: FAD-dependent oxidoreductase [Deltaproteobacteria bacterium]|nr:FAD-dependent oxidoreductase [Deltaproteobacteria bacterium]